MVVNDPISEQLAKEQAISMGVPIFKENDNFGIPSLDGYKKTDKPSLLDKLKQLRRGSLQQSQEVMSVPLPSQQTTGSGVANIPTVQPNGNVRITQPFGNPNARLYGRSKSGRANINRGLDISSQLGEEQFAPPEGDWVVEKTATSGWNTGWGNYVLLKNMKTGETLRRSHLDKVLVKPGQRVTGKVVGTTGRTGRTTGTHEDLEYTDPSGRLSDYSKSPYFKYER